MIAARTQTEQWQRILVSGYTVEVNLPRPCLVTDMQAGLGEAGGVKLDECHEWRPGVRIHKHARV